MIKKDSNRSTQRHYNLHNDSSPRSKISRGVIQRDFCNTFKRVLKIVPGHGKTLDSGSFFNVES